MVLASSSLILRFFTIVGGAILNKMSGILATLTIIAMIFGTTKLEYCYPILILCFLCSEVGLPALANITLDGVDYVTLKLRQV